jgi:hypothetical protein
VEFLVILLAFLFVVFVVSAPLRRGRIEETERREAAELAELEAAKEAKYREIRDAEMDFRTGKLSKEDHRVLDRQLRAEAIQLLRRIDSVKPPAPAGAAGLAAPGADAGEGGPDAEASSADPAASDPAGRADTPRSDARVG